MVKSELNKRSPLRIFEKTMHGGLGKGNIGVIASRKGVGKTACLVHIATDKLLRDQSIIHVSFSNRTDHIINWYEDIFREIAKKRNLEKAVEVHDEIIKKRVIMNFSQDGVEIDKVLNSLRAMIQQGNFAAEAIVVDGYDFAKPETGGLSKVKAFAEELGLEIWIAASLKGKEPIFNNKGVPFELEKYLEEIEVLISLQYHGEYVHLKLVKDHETIDLLDMNLKLDPKTLLIAEE